MKAYTDIEQSQTLKKILPLESADMEWLIDYYGLEEPFSLPVKDRVSANEEPCWSLSALLDVLPKNYGKYTKSLYWFDDGWHCEYLDEDGEGFKGETADNPVDACVEMIIKLKELKLL